MNLMDLFIKIGVDDQATSKIGKITGVVGRGLATAAKVGAAAVGAAATGIAALTKASVDQYAEYEQLVGGVDTLFKGASQKVQQYAADAYKTAGMSANDYMANATAFSASLISALGDDTEAAAEYANRAMVSMSDNANKMGTDIDSIVQTYQSLARGNFAMLDNLKLGYGGTKAELERLIKDASTYTDIQEKMGVTVDASSTSFDNIVNAISVVQGKLGIAGATALEAGTTIEGSLNSMKAAWSNLVANIANENADLGALMDNLVTSIVGDGTDKNLGVLGNIMPAVERALGGIGKVIEKAVPIISAQLPSIANEILPSLLSAAVSLFDGLVAALPGIAQVLIKQAPMIITSIVNTMLGMLPELVNLGLQLVISLANGIADSLPQLIPIIADVVSQIVNTLTNPVTLGRLLNAALALVSALANGIIEAVPQLMGAVTKLVFKFIDFILDENHLNSVIESALEIVLAISEGLIKAIPQLVDATIQIVEKLCEFFLNPENIGKILDMAFDVVVAIVEGLMKASIELLKGARELINKFVDIFNKTDWAALGRSIVTSVGNGLQSLLSSAKNWGRDLIDNFIGGIKSKWENLKKTVSNLAQTVTDFLGFSEPKKGPLSNFHTYAPDMMDLFAKGIRDNENVVTDQIKKSFAFGDQTIGYAADYAGANTNNVGATGAGNTFHDIIINIDGARYSDEQSLAEAVAEAIQSMMDRRTAVYA